MGMYLPGVEMHYPHRFVFIAGLPKSGTTWMENLIESIPGYKRLAPFDPELKLSEHILDPLLLEKIPPKGNFFLKTHIEARPEGVEALKLYRVPTLIMVRDLRDQCVSRYFHVLNQPSHRHHEFYKSNSQEIAFNHCLQITVSEYAEWIRGWLSVLKEKRNLFKLIRYEDLRKDVASCFKEVLVHFDINIVDATTEKIIEDVTNKARKSRDLKKGIRDGTNTFRSGKIGEWRDFFTVEDKSYFKAHANDVLIKCGYESDDSW